MSIIGGKQAQFASNVVPFKSPSAARGPVFGCQSDQFESGGKPASTAKKSSIIGILGGFEIVLGAVGLAYVYRAIANFFFPKKAGEAEAAKTEPAKADAPKSETAKAVEMASTNCVSAFFRNCSNGAVALWENLFGTAKPAAKPATETAPQPVVQTEVKPAPQPVVQPEVKPAAEIVVPPVTQPDASLSAQAADAPAVADNASTTELGTTTTVVGTSDSAPVVATETQPPTDTPPSAA